MHAEPEIVSEETHTRHMHAGDCKRGRAGGCVLAARERLEEMGDDWPVQHGHQALGLCGKGPVAPHDAPKGGGEDEDGGGGKGGGGDDSEERREERGRACERLREEGGQRGVERIEILRDCHGMRTRGRSLASELRGSFWGWAVRRLASERAGKCAARVEISPSWYGTLENRVSTRPRSVPK